MATKNSPKNDGRHFTKIDNSIIQFLPNLKGSTLKVYVVLASRLNTKRADNTAWPSYNSLMKDTGIKDRNAISKATRELEKLGLVRIEREYKKVNTYTLLFPQGSMKIIPGNGKVVGKSYSPSMKTNTKPSMKTNTLTRRSLTKRSEPEGNFPEENSHPEDINNPGDINNSSPVEDIPEGNNHHAGNVPLSDPTPVPLTPSPKSEEEEEESDFYEPWDEPSEEPKPNAKKTSKSEDDEFEEDWEDDPTDPNTHMEQNFDGEWVEVKNDPPSEDHWED